MKESQYKQQIKELQQELTAYRKRVKGELIEAANRGRDQATLLLVDIVDDCERALEIIDESKGEQANQEIKDGLIHLRDRALRRFSEAGLYPFGTVGDIFNPKYHNAIATEDGPGADGTIIKVHQRGWRREDGSTIRTAMVTVLKKDTGYVCPYGSAGCQGDCPDCLMQGDEN